MMTVIKHKLETVPFNINRSLRTFIRYSWIAAGTLFVCYLYFIGAITFSVIKEQALVQQTKALVSSMSQEEVSYLAMQKNLTEDYALQNGLVKVPTVAFATPKRAFAWNVGN